MTINDLPITEALIDVGVQKAVIGAAMRCGDLAAADEGVKELENSVKAMRLRIEELKAMFAEPMGS
jgi:hypothetical protein